MRDKELHRARWRSDADDEFTGRNEMSGRPSVRRFCTRIEAKEGLQIQPENVTRRSVTFQNLYFRL